MLVVNTTCKYYYCTYVALQYILNSERKSSRNRTHKAESSNPT